MDFYVVPQHSLVVGWSRKCACTTVCDWLVNGVIEPTDLLGKVPRAYLTDNGYHWPARDALAKVFNDGFTPVLFTRNPLSRIVSAFLSKFVYRNGRALAEESLLEPFAMIAVKDCYEISGYTGVYKGISLVELLNYVKFFLAQNKRLDGHWAPQIFDGSEENLNLKDELSRIVNGKRFLVRQESFGHDLKNVNCALGLSYLPAVRNATTAPKQWTKFAQQADFGNMPSNEIISKKINLQKNMMLSQEVKQLVKEIYLDDFNLFSYPLPKR